jgi:predicted nuclease of restriction endonuclease-like (RecB) superfamily
LSRGVTVAGIGHRQWPCPRTADFPSEVLEEARADYAAEIVSTVLRQLAARYGRGFNEKSLRRMVQFAEGFPDPEIVATLSRQLGWSHFVELIPLKGWLKRDFYAEICGVERWSIRQLRERINSILFERTSLPKKPEALIRKELSALREKGDVSPALVFRDPYMLDSLELADTYNEKDLESAILMEIEHFILELGSGFAFVERQKRITLDGDDYCLDRGITNGCSGPQRCSEWDGTSQRLQTLWPITFLLRDLMFECPKRLRLQVLALSVDKLRQIFRGTQRRRPNLTIANRCISKGLRFVR